MAKKDRYRRGREFAHVVLGLWDSFDDDAFVRDRESGIFFESSKMHRLDHAGEWFRVAGPLNVSRSPQGRPVMVQAGASEDGMELAAETAEVVFAASTSLAHAQKFYADVKGRLAKHGRSPDDLKIMPGLLVTVAPTREEARRKRDVLQSLIHPEVGLALLEQRLGMSLKDHPVDGPVPDLPPDDVISSRAALLLETARRDNLTIRQLYTSIAGGRGHFEICGTPGNVADVMQEWFENAAADGFNIMPPILPTGLRDFVDLVIPELQRRGLYRTSYEGTTLRANLGLPVPPSRYGAPAR
jgi:FMN-dependent oxidoreductase (nitrilotriacetate monooxygenase family)